MSGPRALRSLSSLVIQMEKMALNSAQPHPRLFVAGHLFPASQPQVSIRNFSAQKGVKATESTEKVNKIQQRSGLQTALVVGAFTAGGAALGYSYYNSLPLKLNIPLEKTGFSSAIKEKAKEIKELLKDPEVSLENVLQKFGFFGSYLLHDSLNETESRVLLCLLHEESLRSKLIELSLQKTHNPLLKSLTEVLETKPVLESSPKLPIVLAVNLASAILPRLTNERISASENFGFAQLMEKVSSALPKDSKKVFSKELIKEGVLQTIFKDENWSSFRSLDYVWFSTFTNLAVLAGRADLVTTMFENSLDRNEVISDRFLGGVVAGLEWSSVSGKQEWQTLALRLLHILDTHPNREVFLQSQRESESTSLAKVAAFAKEDGPRFSKDSWESAFLTICKEKLFPTQLHLVGWTLKMRLSFYNLCLLDVGWVKDKIEVEDWAQFFNSIPIEDCPKAFEMLSPMITDSFNFAKGAGKLHDILSQLHAGRSDILIQNLVSNLGRSLKVMNLESSIDARKSCPDVSKTTITWLLNSHHLGSYLAKSSSRSHSIVDTILSACRIEKSDEERHDLLVRFLSFFGFSSQDRFFYSHEPEGRAKLVNGLLEKMSDDEISSVVKVISNNLYASDRVLCGVFFHMKYNDADSQAGVNRLKKVFSESDETLKLWAFLERNRNVDEVELF